MLDAPDFGLITSSFDAQPYAAGAVIFNEGDPPGEFYVVKSGTVEIRRGDAVLETLHENGIFGEMALVDGQPRSATAIATSDTELVPLSEKQFLYLLVATPYFALNVMRTMAGRLRRSN